MFHFNCNIHTYMKNPLSQIHKNMKYISERVCKKRSHKYKVIYSIFLLKYDGSVSAFVYFRQPVVVQLATTFWNYCFLVHQGLYWGLYNLNCGIKLLVGILVFVLLCCYILFCIKSISLVIELEPYLGTCTYKFSPPFFLFIDCSCWLLQKKTTWLTWFYSL